MHRQGAYIILIKVRIRRRTDSLTISYQTSEKLLNLYLSSFEYANKS